MALLGLGCFIVSEKGSIMPNRFFLNGTEIFLPAMATVFLSVNTNCFFALTLYG